MSEVATSAPPTNWAGAIASIFQTGVSAVVDSQQLKNYQVNDPNYNTAGGYAGQGQYASVLAKTPPLVLLGVAAAVVFLIVAATRR